MSSSDAFFNKNMKRALITLLFSLVASCFLSSTLAYAASAHSSVLRFSVWGNSYAASTSANEFSSSAQGNAVLSSSQKFSAGSATISIAFTRDEKFVAGSTSSNPSATTYFLATASGSKVSGYAYRTSAYLSLNGGSSGKYTTQFPTATLITSSLKNSIAIYDISPYTDAYKTNATGLKYGSLLAEKANGYYPDLITATGNNGIDGYVYYRDIAFREPDTAEEALELYGSPHTEKVTVYAEDGITPVDTLTIYFGYSVCK